MRKVKRVIALLIAVVMMFALTACGSNSSMVSVGDIIEFGTYEQDNDTSIGKEPIEWRVINKKGNKILVISEYALDVQSYNADDIDVTWETCSLRTWLNGIFFDEAFNKTEQKKIKTSSVAADKNPYYDTDPGNDTRDKIFLLSIDEVNKYFASDETKICVPTAYANANGSNVSNCLWWLRSPAKDQDNAAVVSTTGVVCCGGLGEQNYVCIRPAMWIKLKGNFNIIKKLEATEIRAAKNVGSDFNIAEVGDLIEFGAYEQDNNTSNGKEPIEWLVLAKEGNKILATSKYGLDVQPYNTENIDVTWETCSLRTWLNGTFLNEAFNETEQKKIQTTSVTAGDNSDNTELGNDTNDKVFILDIDEADKYFTSYEAKRCVPTEYAITNGAGIDSDYKVDDVTICFVWLRSPGHVLLANAAFVFNISGISPNNGSVCVRPSVCIELDA